MDIARSLAEFLGTGVDSQEIRALCRAAVAQSIREIKLASAQAVVLATSCVIMDDPGGSNATLDQARRLQWEYHEFYAQWLVLEGPAAGGLDREAQGPGPRNAEGPPGGNEGP